MNFDPKTRRRHSLRLRDYDYSQPGAYFLTLCAWNRKSLFGEIIDGSMHPNAIGRIVAEEWLRTATIRPEIELDEWIVMPNHLHGILIISAPGMIVDTRRGDRWSPCPRSLRQRPPQSSTLATIRSRSLGAMVAGFKSAATRRINAWRQTPGADVWQRNYWERIIRDDAERWHIQEYIRGNPAHWLRDELNPSNS